MRLPRMRWTMQRMMVAVAVVAVDFWLIRWAEELEFYHSNLQLLQVSYIFAPTLSLLAIAAVNVARGLVKRGQAPAFSTGYLLVGALASLATCLILVTQLYMLVFELFTDPRAVGATSSIDPFCEILLFVAFFVLPQVALALLGGALALRLRVTLGRESKAREGEGT